MNPNIIKILLRTITISVTLGVLSYIWFFTNARSVSNFDFTAFISGANIIKSGSGKLLYDIGTQKRSHFDMVNTGTLIVYKNPPTLALFFIPFTFLPFGLSYKLIATLLLVFAFYATKLMMVLFRNINRDFLVLATIFFIPGTISVITGQLSYPLLILWIMILRSITNKKDLKTGVLTGLLFNKPQYLLIAPFLLFFVTNRKKYLAGLISVIFVHLLVSGLLVGFHNLPAYLNFLKDTETYIYGSNPYSQISLSAFLLNLSGSVNIFRGREYLINIIFYSVVLFYYYVSYTSRSKMQLLIALPLLILFFSPHVWDYDLTLTLPSFFYLLSFTKSQSSQFKLAPHVVAVLIYFGWNIRFFGFPYLTSLIMFFAAFYIISQQKPRLLSF